MALYDVSTSEKKASPELVAGGTLYADSPIGTILPYGGATAPSGWFICDGTAVSRTTYAELFAVIGDSFGAGDGSTTFNIPDMREVVPVGAGTSNRSAINTHDAYSLGQFKDDQIQDHIHYAYTGRRNGWLQFAAATADGVQIRSQGDAYNNAYSVGEAAQARISTTTHGKQLGVNYIIKAKMVGVPADFMAKVAETISDMFLVVNNAINASGTIAGGEDLRIDMPTPPSGYKYFSCDLKGTGETYVFPRAWSSDAIYIHNMSTATKNYNVNVNITYIKD